VVSRQWAIAMTPDLPPKPSKTHRGENFPVASFLIAPRHRSVILAYYRFARGADDVADSPSLAPDAKLALLDQFEATLTGRSDQIEAALPLRDALAARKLSSRHGLDLLRAFRMDAVKRRYATWSELMDYCAYSAAPVGRFVLDVHGESDSTWPASDALCTALQVINHLQDCGADYRKLDRVYVPEDTLAANGLGVDALGAAKASPALRAVLHAVAQENAPLVALGSCLSAQVRDFRLCLETAVIGRLARKLNALLLERDPLSENVHLPKASVLAWSGIGIADGVRAFFRPRQVTATPIGGA
jgi:hydroxysqualene synthase